MRLLPKLALLLIAGCAPQAFVDTDNAPVARGNLNSVGASVGTIYLYDTDAKSISRIADTRQETAVVNSGSFSQSASSDILLDVRNLPGAAAPTVLPALRAGIANSLAFSMSHYEQRSVSNPEGALNASGSLAFFESQRPRANNENFRYVFIIDGYLGEDINMTWNGRPADGATFEVDTGSPTVPQVKVTVNRGAGIQCQGMANTCVFTAQVFRLRELEDGSLRFDLDTSLTRPGWIQRMFNGKELPERS